MPVTAVLGGLVLNNIRDTKHRAVGEQTQVSEPTSYLAISHLIATMLEKSPFGENGFASADYLSDLPTTEFVAENDSGVMIERGNKYFLRQGKADWKEYADPD